VNIGTRIRKLRVQQRRTLQQIADQVGLTRSMLSKVETGATVPAVATLTKIADALGVKPSVLLDSADGKTTVYAPAVQVGAAKHVKTNRGYRFHAFASERPDKLMQPYLFTARKGEVKRQALTHEGEEFIYMLEGTMRYRVGDTTFTLRPGDTLYFDSEDEHELAPVSAEVKYLAVFTSRGNRT
jgi:transcriptional regulator with XRE-family HTH domain